MTIAPEQPATTTDLAVYEPPARTVADLRQPRTGWYHRAACVGQPAKWWDLNAQDPDGSTANSLRARAICGACPVRQECLLDSIHVPDTKTGYGCIRGGYSPAQIGQLLDRIGVQRPRQLATTNATAVHQRAAARNLDPVLIDGYRTEGATWRALGELLDAPAETVRAQWNRWKAAQSRTRRSRVRDAS
jgi:hypothetical protein